MYKCECGKEFENAQAFNGHKSHCKIHQTKKYGNLEHLNAAQEKREVAAHTNLKINSSMRKKQQLKQWIYEKHVCEHCGKVMTEKFGSGRFCCKSCANARKHTDETKKAISNKLKAGVDRICSKCGKLFHTSDLSRKQCYECLPKTIKYANVKKNQPKTLLDLSKRTISKILLRIDMPCTCCGEHINGVVFDLHHIIPKHLSGSDAMTNLTYICPNCHRIAHTDMTLLPNSLISIEQYFKEHNINWLDYYYIKK